MTEAERAPGGPFGLVIFSLNGLMHLSDIAAQRAALASARRALDPRGMLVIDVLNPIPELLATLDGRVQHEGTWRKSDGTVVDRFSVRTHDSAEQRIDTELWYDLTDPGGHIQRVRSGFPLRYLCRVGARFAARGQRVRGMEALRIVRPRPNGAMGATA